MRNRRWLLVGIAVAAAQGIPMPLEFLLEADLVHETTVPLGESVPAQRHGEGCQRPPLVLA